MQSTFFLRKLFEKLLGYVKINQSIIFYFIFWQMEVCRVYVPYTGGKSLSFQEIRAFRITFLSRSFRRKETSWDNRIKEVIYGNKRERDIAVRS